MAPPNKINKEVVESSRKFEAEQYIFKYGFKDTILYNLAVGASLEDDDLRYLYEKNESFEPVQTMGTLPGIGFLDKVVKGDVPGLCVDLGNLLHAEHYIKIYSPMLAEDKLINTYKVEDILDKGEGGAAVIVVGVESRNTAGEVVLYNQASLFLVGQGGWGGQRSSQVVKPVMKPPAREPDSVVSFRTSADQAALYRLTGDLNPLHIDLHEAQKLKLRSPILHGLCSVGITVLQIQKEISRICNLDLSLAEMKVRMSHPVTPGQTLKIEMWNSTSKNPTSCEKSVLFRTKIEETDEICLTGGWIILKENN